MAKTIICFTLFKKLAYKVAIMSHPRPFRTRFFRKKSGKPPKAESPWKRAWRLAPERMREHLTQMNEARSKQSEQRGELVQALLNMMSVEPVQPYVMRNNLKSLWKECYNEDKTDKESWNLIRMAMRKGMIGRTDNNLIYPRKV
jgi:hypothetical protein